MRSIGLLITAALGLSGCMHVGAPATYAASPATIGAQKDGPLQLDLVRLLQPTAPAGTSLETALAYFNSDRKDLKLRRNAVAMALLAASDRNCDIYLEDIRGFQAGWRTTSSMVGTALGAAGSIVTDSNSSRLFSGLASTATGVSGKLDENILAGLGADAILTGVRAGREGLRREIVQDLSSDYDTWPVELAIADVLRYHGRCNVISGMSAAQKMLGRTSEADDDDNTTNNNVTATSAPKGAGTSSGGGGAAARTMGLLQAD